MTESKTCDSFAGSTFLKYSSQSDVWFKPAPRHRGGPAHLIALFSFQGANARNPGVKINIPQLPTFATRFFKIPEKFFNILLTTNHTKRHENFVDRVDRVDRVMSTKSTKSTKSTSTHNSTQHHNRDGCATF